MFYLNARQIWKFKTISVISNNLWKLGCSWCRMDKKNHQNPLTCCFFRRMLALVRSFTSSSPLCSCCWRSLSHFLMSPRLWSNSSERLASNSSRAFSCVVDSSLSHSSWSLARRSLTMGSNSGLASIRSEPSCVGTHQEQDLDFTSVAKYKKLNVDIKLLTV